MKSYNVQSEYQVKNKQTKSKHKLDHESTVRLWKLVISAVFMIAGFIGIFGEPINIVLYFMGYFVIGGSIVLKAVKNIFHGEIFDENFLMTIATVGALILGEYPEAVAVMFFYEVGNLFVVIATKNSKKSISA